MKQQLYSLHTINTVDNQALSVVENIQKTIVKKKTITEISSDLLCQICKERPQEQLHHLDFNHKNNKPENHQLICTLCHAKIHGIEPRISELKRLVLLHNRTQKARCSIDNQIRGYSRIEIIVPEFMHGLSNILKEKEKQYEKEIKLVLSESRRIVETHRGDAYPIYSWLKDIKGISYLLSAKLISYIDISKSPTVSSLWAYAGQAPDSRKKKGKKSNWNQELKMICFQIGDSFIKQRTPKYREIYDIEKAKQMNLLESNNDLKTTNTNMTQDLRSEPTDKMNTLRHTGSVPSSKMHAHRRAIRKAVKEFLKDYWIESNRGKEEWK